MESFELLDATLDLNSDNITESFFDDIVQWINREEFFPRPWINWNVKMQKDSTDLSAASLALHLILPGTITIQDGSINDEKLLSELTSLRRSVVPIYMNGNYKPCGNCQGGTLKEVNYVVRHPESEVIQFERFFNRRNRYVLVSNFGSEVVRLSSVSKTYSGGDLILSSYNSTSLPANDDDEDKRVVVGHYALFKDIYLQPGNAIVIKLPK